MLLYFGDRSRLQGRHWYMLELSAGSGVGTHGTVRRIGRAMPGIFFIPIAARQLNDFILSTVNLLFVRSTSFPAVRRIKTIADVEGMVPSGLQTAMPVEDDCVQKLIHLSQQDFDAQSAGINIGRYVRVLDGRCKDYCGHVTSGRSAEVKVSDRWPAISSNQHWEPEQVPTD